MDRLIYVDFDGVLVNFRKRVNELLGLDIDTVEFNNLGRGHRGRLYSEACDSVDFWANLEPMPDFQELWSYIKYWNPCALTAYPEWNVNAKELAVAGKWLWNKKHTMIPESRFYCVKRKEKQIFALNNGMVNILIDDKQKNIDEWINAGGIGILHTNAMSTICRLKLLGFDK